MRISTALLVATLFAVAVIPARAQTQRRELDLAAPDGTKLKASFFAAAKPGPGILLLHMCGNGGRKPWANLATQLGGRGFHVLTLDYRGFGESGGERFESLDAQGRRAAQEKWPGDFDVAFGHLLAQPGVDKTRIGAAGASCGANNSVQLAIRHPEVKALAFLSGGTNQAGLDHIRRADRLPIFAASSEDDYGFVPYMRWLMLFSRHPLNKLLEYKKAGHGTDMFTAEEGLEPMIVEWFSKALGDTASRASGAAPAKPDPMVEFWSTLTGPDGVARASKALQGAKQRDPRVVLFPEYAALLLGYDQLRAGDAKGAVALLRLGVEAYPASPILHSSLSAAHLAAGDREMALECTERTLHLLEKDVALRPEQKQLIRQRAEERLKQLKP